MTQVLVFDVNETLLDLSALDSYFTAAFGSPDVRREWFERTIQSAMLGVITESYVPFGEVAAGALRMVEARAEVSLRDEDRVRILGGMRRLPPHSEVPGALSRLKEAGLRLAALTNSTLEVAREQLEYAGLNTSFERILSADAVRRLKPAREVYEHAARELGVPTSQLRLVAAHDWDVAGAMHAGLSAAFVARPGKVLNPLAPAPDIVGQDLSEVAEALLALGH